MTQNLRKLANQYTENWEADHPIKCRQCNQFHKDNQSGEESQSVDAKTSEEAFSVANSEENTEEAYIREREHQSLESPHDTHYQHRDMKLYAAELVLAELKELQWRRDTLERHYTDGVRKIINDYFFGDAKYVNGQTIITPRNQERMRAGGIKKSQSHGIRLECGCMHNCDRIRKKNSIRHPLTSVNYPRECKGSSTIMIAMNPFVTTNHDEFVWPHQLPLKMRPRPPPKTARRRVYMSRIDPDECECDAHNIKTSLNRYEKLSKKERDLCKDIAQVNHQMTTVMSDILENPLSSEDEVMKSVYQIMCNKNEKCFIEYRSFMAAVDSPIDSPIAPVISQLGSAYRDPIRFRCSPGEVPVIEPAEPVNSSRGPETFSAWARPLTGRSEYMDTISKLGRNNLRNQQQYFEPRLSSRRRWGDCRQ